MKDWNNLQQTTALSNDVDKLVERYRQEFDMTYATVIGVLTMKSHCLTLECIEINRLNNQDNEEA